MQTKAHPGTIQRSLMASQIPVQVWVFPFSTRTVIYISKNIIPIVSFLFYSLFIKLEICNKIGKLFNICKYFCIKLFVCMSQMVQERKILPRFYDFLPFSHVFWDTSNNSQEFCQTIFFLSTF